MRTATLNVVFDIDMDDYPGDTIDEICIHFEDDIESLIDALTLAHASGKIITVTEESEEENINDW